MKIAFTKMHGIGNSYIYLDLFRYDYKDDIFCELAKKIANVHTGIGSDGLIIIQPSKIADCGMRIFNKDGTEGSNCGNGLRCVAKYIFERQIVRQKYFTIETKAGIMHVEVVVQDNIVTDVIVDIGKPLLYRKDIPMLGNPNELVINELFTLPPHNLFLTAMFLGNPNAVFFINDIEKAPLRILGGSIENDVRFPNRINVEFVQVIHPKALQFRVWE